MDDIVLQDCQIASYVALGLLVAVAAERNVAFAHDRMWEALVKVGWRRQAHRPGAGHAISPPPF